MTNSLSILCVVIYLGALMLAAGWDLASRTIPNILAGTIAVAAAGLLLVAAPGSLPSHCAAASAVLAVGAVLFALRLWGAGDAKLLAASAVIFGGKGLLLLIVGTAMAGGVLALLCLAARMLPPSAGRAVAGIPYGVAIACGAFIALVATDAPDAIAGL